MAATGLPFAAPPDAVDVDTAAYTGSGGATRHDLVVAAIYVGFALLAVAVVVGALVAALIS